MTSGRPVKGFVQHYAWGDRHFLPQFLGVTPDGQPWAELWLGTHPNGPTYLADGTPLANLTGELPYLLKVLSAAEPLSLQAHPTASQARKGFDRGVFADPHAKPELLVALTPFEALCGVRPEARTVELLRAITADDLADVVEAEGAGVAMERLYHGDLDAASAVKACASSDRPEARWVQRLDTMYPRDPSVAVTLLLNHVSLLPGEALHLTAGNLHGYLSGSGIELMQASDNVVRGGLTVKHVDIDLLLSVVDSTPLVEPVMRVINGRYKLPEAEVQLIWLNTGENHTSTGHELALSVAGDQLYLAPNTQFVASADTFVVTSI